MKSIRDLSYLRHHEILKMFPKWTWKEINLFYKTRRSYRSLRRNRWRLKNAIHLKTRKAFLCFEQGVSFKRLRLWRRSFAKVPVKRAYRSNISFYQLVRTVTFINSAPTTRLFILQKLTPEIFKYTFWLSSFNLIKQTIFNFINYERLDFINNLEFSIKPSVIKSSSCFFLKNQDLSDLWLRSASLASRRKFKFGWRRRRFFRRFYRSRRRFKPLHLLKVRKRAYFFYKRRDRGRATLNVNVMFNILHKKRRPFYRFSKWFLVKTAGRVKKKLYKLRRKHRRPTRLVLLKASLPWFNFSRYLRKFVHSSWDAFKFKYKIVKNLGPNHVRTANLFNFIGGTPLAHRGHKKSSLNRNRARRRKRRKNKAWRRGRSRYGIGRKLLRHALGRAGKPPQGLKFFRSTRPSKLRIRRRRFYFKTYTNLGKTVNALLVSRTADSFKETTDSSLIKYSHLFFKPHTVFIKFRRRKVKKVKNKKGKRGKRRSFNWNSLRYAPQSKYFLNKNYINRTLPPTCVGYGGKFKYSSFLRTRVSNIHTPHSWQSRRFRRNFWYLSRFLNFRRIRPRKALRVNWLISRRWPWNFRFFKPSMHYKRRYPKLKRSRVNKKRFGVGVKFLSIRTLPQVRLFFRQNRRRFLRFRTFQVDKHGKLYIIAPRTNNLRGVGFLRFLKPMKKLYSLKLKYASWRGRRVSWHGFNLSQLFRRTCRIFFRRKLYYLIQNFEKNLPAVYKQNLRNIGNLRSTLQNYELHTNALTGSEGCYDNVIKKAKIRKKKLNNRLKTKKRVKVRKGVRPSRPSRPSRLSRLFRKRRIRRIKKLVTLAALISETTPSIFKYDVLKTKPRKSLINKWIRYFTYLRFRTRSFGRLYTKVRPARFGFSKFSFFYSTARKPRKPSRFYIKRRAKRKFLLSIRRKLLRRVKHNLKKTRSFLNRIWIPQIFNFFRLVGMNPTLAVHSGASNGALSKRAETKAAKFLKSFLRTIRNIGRVLTNPDLFKVKSKRRFFTHKTLRKTFKLRTLKRGSLKWFRCWLRKFKKNKKNKKFSTAKLKLFRSFFFKKKRSNYRLVLSRKLKTLVLRKPVHAAFERFMGFSLTTGKSNNLWQVCRFDSVNLTGGFLEPSLKTYKLHTETNKTGGVVNTNKLALKSLNWRDYLVFSYTFDNFLTRKLLNNSLNLKTRPRNYFEPSYTIYSSSYLVSIVKRYMEFKLNTRVCFFINFEMLHRLCNVDLLYLTKVKVTLRAFKHRFSTVFFLNEFLDMIFIAFKVKNFKLLVPYFNKILKSLIIWHHKTFLQFFFKVVRDQMFPWFERFGVTGLRVLVKGKVGVGGNSRKRWIGLNIGKTTNTNFNQAAHSLNTLLNTNTGALGFKLVLFYNHIG